MSEPAVEASDDTDADTPEEPDNGENVEDDEEEVDMVKTDVETTGVDPDGFFDEVEAESGGDAVDNDMFDGVDDAADSDEDDGGSNREPNTSLAENINRGFSRAAVIGLDETWETEDGDEKNKEDLRKEFEETFEMFRLGHYGSICAEEYLNMEDDIHPAWGLLGASLICSAVIVYKRPDGEDLLETSKLKLGSTDLSSLKEKMSKSNSGETEEDE